MIQSYKIDSLKMDIKNLSKKTLDFTIKRVAEIIGIFLIIISVLLFIFSIFLEYKKTLNLLFIKVFAKVRLIRPSPIIHTFIIRF